MDGEIIEKHLDDFMNGDTPGVNRTKQRNMRRSCAKLVDTKGRVLKGALALIAFHATARNVGAAITEDPACQRMRAAVLQFIQDPTNCELLSGARSSAEQCYIAIGEAIGENQGGITASGGLDQWDKLIDKCNKARREREKNCCK